MDDLETYFRGEKLYGDDFDIEAIRRWFAEEAEAYATLGNEDDPRVRNADRQGYMYGYHALNRAQGYRFLPPEQTFKAALSFGGAYGDELLPLADRLGSITIVEPSETLRAEHLAGKPLHYVTPDPSGKLPFSDGAFDLVTCLGALHHVPNVSTVVGELARCLGAGGYALIREPIVSMGDWRKPRPGLTRHERGIPLGVFDALVRSVRFQVIRRTLNGFPATFRLRGLLRGPLFNRPAVVRLDAWLCRLTAWNYRYHAKNPLLKLRPTNVFYVLRK